MRFEKETKTVRVRLNDDMLAPQKSRIGPMTFLLLSQAKKEAGKEIKAVDAAEKSWTLAQSFENYVDKNIPAPQKNSASFKSSAANGHKSLAEYLVTMQTTIVLEFIKWRVINDDDKEEELEEQEQQDAAELFEEQMEGNTNTPYDAMMESTEMADEDDSFDVTAEAVEETEEDEFIDDIEIFQEEIISEFPNMPTLTEKAEWILLGEHIHPGNVAFRANALQYLNAQLAATPFEKELLAQLNTVLTKPFVKNAVSSPMTQQLAASSVATQNQTDRMAALTPHMVPQSAPSPIVQATLENNTVENVPVSAAQLKNDFKPITARALLDQFRDNGLMLEPVFASRDADLELNAAPNFATRQLAHANNPFYIGNPLSAGPPAPSFAMAIGAPASDSN